VGEVGPEAYRFIDFLANSEHSLWQVLPLGPAGPGYSPYASFSAFAGNPLMISMDRLVEDGLLTKTDLEPLYELPRDFVDFPRVEEKKEILLRKAFRYFKDHASETMRNEFWEYCQAPLTSSWLEDFVLFMSIKQSQDNKPWIEWAPELARREHDALESAASSLSDEMWYHRFLQWEFDRQWKALRKYAHSRNVHIIGDMPIYVADDSADVWSSPGLFDLDENGKKRTVAGVPPDYFSKTGQLWGNPLYRWDVAERTDFAWWTERFRVL